MDYVNEGGFQVCSAFHWPWQRMLEQGFVIFLRQARLQYLQSAVFEHELEISAWVSSVQRASAGRHYTLHRAYVGLLLAQVFTKGVWVDLDTQQLLRIPQGMLNDFATNIVGQD